MPGSKGSNLWQNGSPPTGVRPGRSGSVRSASPVQQSRPSSPARPPFEQGGGPQTQQRLQWPMPEYGDPYAANPPPTSTHRRGAWTRPSTSSKKARAKLVSQTTSAGSDTGGYYDTGASSSSFGQMRKTSKIGGLGPWGGFLDAMAIATNMDERMQKKVQAERRNGYK